MFGFSVPTRILVLGTFQLAVGDAAIETLILSDFLGREASRGLDLLASWPGPSVACVPSICVYQHSSASKSFFSASLRLVFSLQSQAALGLCG